MDGVFAIFGAFVCGVAATKAVLSLFGEKRHFPLRSLSVFCFASIVTVVSVMNASATDDQAMSHKRAPSNMTKSTALPANQDSMIVGKN